MVLEVGDESIEVAVSYGRAVEGIISVPRQLRRRKVSGDQTGIVFLDQREEGATVIGEKVVLDACPNDKHTPGLRIKSWGSDPAAHRMPTRIAG